MKEGRKELRKEGRNKLRKERKEGVINSGRTE